MRPHAELELEEGRVDSIDVRGLVIGILQSNLGEFGRVEGQGRRQAIFGGNHPFGQAHLVVTESTVPLLEKLPVEIAVKAAVRFEDPGELHSAEDVFGLPA